ncbi:MAG: hypothetical protein V2I46_14595 [Bacteroides sp.]|jgi:hypothetical protein|nr:hypothetical protein [Bacteroides sp.]
MITIWISRKKWYVWISMDLLLIILFYTLLIMANSSISWMINTENENAGKTAYPTYDRASRNDLYRLEMESTMVHNRLVLSDLDSVYLLCNLADSAASIELEGLPLHQGKVLSAYISPVIKELNKEALLQWLSKPMVSVSEISTLEKQPVYLRRAPRDTTEAALQKEEHVTVENFAGFLLQFDNGLILQIRQSDNAGFRQAWQEVRFNIDIFSTHRLSAILQAITFREPEYHPSIILEMDRQDVIILYRAMPAKVSAALVL